MFLFNIFHSIDQRLVSLKILNSVIDLPRRHELIVVVLLYNSFMPTQ